VSRRRTPAEEARIRLLAQEAEAERLEREIERRMGEEAEARRLMEGEAIYEPHALCNRDDQWEALELERINRNRPPWRICSMLPDRCYEAARCNRYALRGHS
jgi:sulfite reductase beta subunit-like hemoprotein